MGILEKIQKELKETKRELKVLREMLSTRKKEIEPEWLKVSDLAKRYGVSTDAIDVWLPQMAEEGYAVTVARVTDVSPRMVNVEQFHRAFMVLFANKEVA